MRALPKQYFSLFRCSEVLSNMKAQLIQVLQIETLEKGLKAEWNHVVATDKTQASNEMQWREMLCRRDGWVRKRIGGKKTTHTHKNQQPIVARMKQSTTS